MLAIFEHKVCEKIRELLNLLYARGLWCLPCLGAMFEKMSELPPKLLCVQGKFGACNLLAQSLKRFEIPQTFYILMLKYNSMLN